MGKAVEIEAHQRHHDVVHRLDRDCAEDEVRHALGQVEVAIEFTQPESVLKNIQLALECKTPLVTGTTGWYERLDEVHAWCKVHQGAVLYASNFSIGVNLFFKAAAYLAKMMYPYDDYQASIQETHHVHKKDAPSGTAITLARKVMEVYPSLTKWQLSPPASHSQEVAQNTIPIEAKREGEVFGRHQLAFESEIDRIALSHEAKNRRGFALGAVQAAEWLSQRSGFYSMDDFISL